MTMHPSRPLPEDWKPEAEQLRDLSREFGTMIDLNISLRRFKAFYAEGQTSRNWSSKFDLWVTNDAQRARERIHLDTPTGTDEYGKPYRQRESSIPDQDPDVVEANIQAAIEAARAAKKEQP